MTPIKLQHSPDGVTWFDHDLVGLEKTWTREVFGNPKLQNITVRTSLDIPKNNKTTHEMKMSKPDQNLHVSLLKQDICDVSESLKKSEIQRTFTKTQNAVLEVRCQQLRYELSESRKEVRALHKQIKRQSAEADKKTTRLLDAAQKEYQFIRDGLVARNDELYSIAMGAISKLQHIVDLASTKRRKPTSVEVAIHDFIQAVKSKLGL